MAAGQGFKTFTTGEVLTAGDVNGYLMQGINVFADATARDAAITAPAEGQFAFTKDNNSLWYYDGAAWVASGATGDIEGVTAGVGISGGGTSGTVTVTNSMATTIDAKGDLVPGTGADTFARLAVGANGTVLTADSAEATGLKWATPSSSPTFVGCYLDVSSDLSVPNSTVTTVPFNNERFDTNNFHDNSTNNSRITIPAGYAGKYLVNANLVYSGSTASNREWRIYKNGTNTINYYSFAPTSSAVSYTASVILNLAVNDYIEMKVVQNSGSTLTLFGYSSLGAEAGSTFSVAYLGA